MCSLLGTGYYLWRGGGGGWVCWGTMFGTDGNI